MKTILRTRSRAGGANMHLAIDVVSPESVDRAYEKKPWQFERFRFLDELETLEHLLSVKS
jgi:hypothetical protein